jgi:pimeloyl-ACP methyl ester carboxylesterase
MRARFLASTVAAVAAGAAAAPSAAADVTAPSDAGFGSLGAATGLRFAQPPACPPVARIECGSLRVPLFHAKPAAKAIDVGYALMRHRDTALPAARGTVVLNPGGPGADPIAHAPAYDTELADLLIDHDVLLIDPRGTGQSSPIRCGLTALPATRKRFTRALAACRQTLGRRARAYTSAQTADDIEAVRAHLGIPKLDLLGQSYGAYLMTVYAQRHPASVRSIVLSSGPPLDFDMWGRPTAEAVRLAFRRVCARSTTGKCNGRRTVRQLGRLARRLRTTPIRYKAAGERRMIDETALAGIAAGADVQIGALPIRIRAALRGNTAPLINAARAVDPFSGSSAQSAGPDQALTYSVVCNDYPTLWNRRAPVPVRLRRFAARRARLADRPFRPFSARAVSSAIADHGNACIRWPDRRGPVQRTSGPFPDVPVLATAGDLDPNVPTREARQAARQFATADVVEVPNAGHVPEGEPTGCAASIVFDFIRNQRLGDTSCLAAIPPVPVS